MSPQDEEERITVRSSFSAECLGGESQDSSRIIWYLIKRADETPEARSWVSLRGSDGNSDDRHRHRTARGLAGFHELHRDNRSSAAPLLSCAASTAPLGASYHVILRSQEG
jgi:hypothetical protein